jgi:YD repeat-containing protein
MSIKLKVTGKEITTNAHYLLGGLDKPSQHPISAIIGLQDALDSKYIKPIGGIPASDLAEKYVSQSALDNQAAAMQSLYASCRILIDKNTENISENTTNIKINEGNITKINTELDEINNRLIKIPDKDTIFNGSSSIHQEKFEATDNNKIFKASILDTDLKVITPTIIKDNVLYKGNYTVDYPNDTTLEIKFEENGTYLINYLSGPVSESEYEVLLKYLKILEDRMLKYSSGSIVKPAHNVQYVYDETSGNLLQEIYKGNINKTVKYEYDGNGNISKKTVIQDDTIKTATYSYDNNSNLIGVDDTGTDIPIDGTRAKSFTCTITYDENSNVLKEVYAGDINKTIEYTYNNYSDVLTKTVTEDGTTKSAKYIYDQNRKLIEIVDNGTEAVAIVFSASNTNGSGSNTGGSSGESLNDFDPIAKADIDLIFNTIFKELV